MLLNYNKLWKLLIDKGINKTQLCEKANISSTAMAKLGKNEAVHLNTILKICEFLNCKIEDVVEFAPKKESNQIVRGGNYNERN